MHLKIIKFGISEQSSMVGRWGKRMEVESLPDDERLWAFEEMDVVGQKILVSTK